MAQGLCPKDEHFGHNAAMPYPRPAIPAEIKRAVRQRCGFGCVICGNPFVEYDHLLGWAETERHVADELTLLCVQHHGEKTRGLLSGDDVAKANRDPFNMRGEWSAPYALNYGSRPVKFILGTNTFEAPRSPWFIAVKVDSTTILGFRFERGVCLVKVRLFDADGAKVLEILDNEVVFAAGAWDVEFVANRLTIRRAMGAVVLALTFDVPGHRLLITKLDMVYKGYEIQADSRRLTVSGFTFVGASVVGPVGVMVGDVPECQSSGNIFIGGAA